MRIKGLIVAIIMTMMVPVQAAEEDLYDFLWLDPDKSVYVLQKKMYAKKRTVYFNAGFLTNNASDFQDTIGASLKLGYFFKEDWGLEFLYNAYNNSNNETFENVQSVNGSEPFIRRPNSLMGLTVQWSPFYGKINTFNKIYYFDWSFGLGVGKLSTESNADTASLNTTSNTYTDESFTGIIAKTNFRFYFTKRIHMDVDYISTTYSAPGPKVNDVQTDSTTTSSDFAISLGFSF